jgi:hypothetical protein
MINTSFGTTRRKKLYHAVLTKKYADGGIDEGLAPIHAIYTMLGYDTHPSPQNSPRNGMDRASSTTMASKTSPAHRDGQNYRHSLCRSEWQMKQQAKLAYQQQQLQQQAELQGSNSSSNASFTF